MPIPILQYGVKLRDPTTKQFSDLAALRGGQGPQGQTGPGVPAGGSDGDVLVKNGATDYDARWTPTPPQMRSLAYIEQTSTVSKQNGYQPGEYLVYNGQLYKVTATISQGQTLNPGRGGNITLVAVMEHLYDSGLIDLYRSGDHYVTYRKLNGVVYINARIPSTANQRVWTIGTLPIGFRPATRAFTSAVFTDVSPINAYLNITTDGGVALVNWDNSAHPDIYFQTSFTV